MCHEGLTSLRKKFPYIGKYCINNTTQHSKSALPTNYAKYFLNELMDGWMDGFIDGFIDGFVFLSLIRKADPGNLTCLSSLLVHIPHELNNHKHGNRMTTTSRIIRQKSIVERKKTFLGTDRLNRLHRRNVRQPPRLRIRLLRGHPILRRLEGHGSDRVQQSGRHGRTKHVRDRILLLVELRHVQFLELVQGGDLEDADHHGALDEGGGSAPEGCYAFFSDDALGGVDDAFVISSFGEGEGAIV
mmetsp:Transcript_7309/g.10670  ORF Transcript_7309/g.10670 Transcript_7309/m.10670 type:complete len:244 (-) Transcript_7309:25-756(-)